MRGREPMGAPGAHDPGCVKTHTLAKCEKYNSPIRCRAEGAQHDLTLTARNSSEICYACGDRVGFYAAKTHTGHRRIGIAVYAN